MRNGSTTIDDSGDKLRLAMVSIWWSNLKVVLFLFFSFFFFHLLVLGILSRLHLSSFVSQMYPLISYASRYHFLSRTVSSLLVLFVCFSSLLLLLGLKTDLFALVPGSQNNSTRTYSLREQSRTQGQNRSKGEQNASTRQCSSERGFG